MGMLPFSLSPSTRVRTEVRKSTVLYHHSCNEKSLRLRWFSAFPMVIQLISEFRFNLDLKPSNISVIILYFSFGTVKFDDPLRQGYESFFF